jgi:hypothetical protein
LEDLKNDLRNDQGDYGKWRLLLQKNQKNRAKI